LDEELDAVEQYSRRNCLTTHAVHMFVYSGAAVLDVLGHNFGIWTGHNETMAYLSIFS